MLTLNLAGIDVAWKMGNNPSAIAIGQLQGGVLTVTEICPSVRGREAVLAAVGAEKQLAGIAVDGPLIINNATGKRPGETAVSRRFASRGAATHASNLSLYPNADTVWLAKQLEAQGFDHAVAPPQRFQLECYPHAALIEIFELPKRLLYKRKPGVNIAGQRDGQVALARLLRTLSNRQPLALDTTACRRWLNEDRIQLLRGQALKDNEDVLDALVCLYVAGLFAGGGCEVLGDIRKGYIVVPKPTSRAVD